MPSSSSPSSPDVLASQDRQALLRFVTWNLDRGFRMAVVEAESHAEREQILAPLLPLVGPRVLQVDLAQLEGHNLWHELLTLYKESAPRLIVLSGVVSGTEHDYLRQLNVQRDLFTRDMKVPWIVLLHPAQRVPLLTIAPDFSDYVVLWIRKEQSAPTEGRNAPLEPPPELPSAPLPDSVHPFLALAGFLVTAKQFDQAEDLLSQFDLLPDPPGSAKFLRRILGARLAIGKGQLHSAENMLLSCRADLVAATSGAPTDNLYGLEVSLGQVLMQQGRYSDATSAFVRAADLAAQVFGDESTLCCIPLTQLAQALWVQGKFADADEQLQRCLELYEKNPDHVPPVVTASLRQGAMHLFTQGQYAEAETLLRHMIAADSKAGKPDSEGSTVLESMLGAVLREQGKYAEAADLLRRSLTRSERRFGIHDPRTDPNRIALAGILQDQGKDLEAEELLRSCVVLQEEYSGPKHINYAMALHGLARNLYRQRKHVEAEALMMRCLELTAQTLGTAHPIYSWMLSSLAMIRLELGRAESAETLAQQAIEILEKVHGPSHPTMGHRLYELALIQHNMGQPQAWQTAQRAVDVLTQSLGQEHPITQRAVKLLGELPGPQGAPLLAAG